MTDDKRTFTEAEIKEVNETIARIQESISLVEDDVKAMDFNNALKNIVIGMKTTNCPVCKEKLLKLSTDIIKTKKSCDTNDGKCNIMINNTIEKAREIKNEFIPIATEKNFSHNKKGILDIPSAQSIIDKINAGRENA